MIALNPRRLASRARLALAMAMTCAMLAGTISVATAEAASPRVQATQELVVLLSAQSARRAPEAGSPQVTTVAARRPITGERTTLPVIVRTIGAGGTRWLQVMLPGRPNGATGWILETATKPLVSPWRLVVHLATRRVVVYSEGRVVKSFPAVVGKPSTPTPTGQFFVEETLQMSAGEPGGPFALALSARSNVFQEFEGGPGQIAVHGRENLGGTLGTAASHGCVRLATASIDWLASRIGPGVPVTIEAG